MSRAKLSTAKRVIENWRQCFISAIEAEAELIREGFYNVNFRRGHVRAYYLGVEYDLEA